MLVPALFAMAATVGEGGLPADLGAFTAEASAWLLDGETVPRDYRVRLLRMPPPERLQAIVFLRRAGLLTDDAWSLADILKPASADEESAP